MLIAKALQDVYGDMIRFEKPCRIPQQTTVVELSVFTKETGGGERNWVLTGVDCTGIVHCKFEAVGHGVPISVRARHSDFNGDYMPVSVLSRLYVGGRVDDALAFM